MRILVTGSRDWEDRLAVYRVLNEVCEEFDLNFIPDEYGNTLPDPTKITVVHGACPSGADLWTDEWCVGSLFKAETHPVDPADWKRLGRRAGPMRNQEMVDMGADLCLAFIKNNSRGATHCSTAAEKAGIPVRYYREDN